MKDVQKKYCGDKEMGQRVKYWRKVRNLSQSKLAEKVSVSQSVITRLESGELLLVSGLERKSRRKKTERKGLPACLLAECKKV